MKESKLSQACAGPAGGRHRPTRGTGVGTYRPLNSLSSPQPTPPRPSPPGPGPLQRSSSSLIAIPALLADGERRVTPWRRPTRPDLGSADSSQISVRGRAVSRRLLSSSRNTNKQKLLHILQASPRSACIGSRQATVLPSVACTSTAPYPSTEQPRLATPTPTAPDPLPPGPFRLHLGAPSSIRSLTYTSCLVG